MLFQRFLDLCRKHGNQIDIPRLCRAQQDVGHVLLLTQALISLGQPQNHGAYVGQVARRAAIGKFDRMAKAGGPRH
jgi:hypothetical protein